MDNTHQFNNYSQQFLNKRNASNTNTTNAIKPLNQGHHLNNLQFRQLSNNTNDRGNSYANFFQNINVPHKFNNTNLIGEDSDITNNLKPLYKNYNIDVSQWPLTNPPIFENFINPYDDSDVHGNFAPHMMIGQHSHKGQTVDDGFAPNNFISDKDRRRRRVSISNGQIDQLNNDILLVDQLYYSQPPVYPKLLMNQVTNIPEMGKMVKIEPTDDNLNNNNILQSDNSDFNSQQKQSVSQDNLDSSDEKNFSKSNSNNKKGGAKRILPPSNTLIPGTPEYKKARLLERNRIAAMKCRQRKKLERDLMERDYDRIVSENRELKKKLQELEALLISNKTQ